MMMLSGEHGVKFWRRHLWKLSIMAGIAFYIAAIIAVFFESDFQTALLDHLAVRGIACALAAMAMLAAILAFRPQRKLPWIMSLILIASYTLRPITMHSGHILIWGGWLIFFMIALQAFASVATLAAIIHLRRTRRMTDTRIEIAIILISYSAVVIPFVAVPGWLAFDLLPVALALGVVAPAGFVLVTAFVARLIFIDILRGRAFQLIMAGWIITILGDVIAHNVFELSGWAFGAAAFDVYPLTSFLWVAACLHPGMHEVSRPATEVRGDWSAIRSFAIVTAAALPLVVGVYATHTSDLERMVVAVLGSTIIVMLFIRARIAVDAYAASERNLLELSQTDPLTHLLNRRGLVSRAIDEHRPLGVAYVDIDGFKLLNDVHGHDYGDRLLLEAAGRLADIGAGGLAAARIGGDEFALLFANDDVQSADITRVAIEQAFRREFHLGQAPVRVTASAGIAVEDEAGVIARVTGNSFESGRSALLELLRRADIAQYYAKSDGGSCGRFYTDAMQSKRVREQQIIELLKITGEDSSLWLDYQAIVDIESGRIAGAEALARMHSPGLGMVSPVEFIPLAERHGHISRLGDWVFRTVLEHVETSIDRMPAEFTVSANLSPLQLSSDDFLEVILETAYERPKAASRIRIEVTESAFVDDTSLARLARIKKAGYSIAIDDFGSEYASLQYLARLEVDVLKLDQSFTRRIATETSSRLIVQHVIDLASQMGIIVITEGIETEAEREILASMGCHFGQGYLWDRPAPGLERIIGMSMSGNRTPDTARTRRSA